MVSSESQIFRLVLMVRARISTNSVTSGVSARITRTLVTDMDFIADIDDTSIRQKRSTAGDHCLNILRLKPDPTRSPKIL